jgi:hypothetical protein
VGSLNSSQRSPSDTDKKHVQGRLQHLTVARRAHQRASASATGLEEEHGELEELLDDITGESDEFMASEAGRREALRAREASLAEIGRQARDINKRRQAVPTEECLPPRSHEVGLGDTSSDEDGGENAVPVHRECRSSTPGSAGSSSLSRGDGLEGEGLRLMQANTSAFSAETTRNAAWEPQRLSMEMGRETRQRDLDRARVEVEKRRAKREEDREARLQRKENREAKLEELRIEAQPAQTSVTMEMMEMMKRKEI